MVTGPSLMGEKPTSPEKWGVYWWVVITVVIVLDTAFPRKTSRLVAAGCGALRVELKSGV